VWAMNIGESPRVSDEAWWTFCDRLPHTKLAALFAEPNHLPKGVKPKMIEALRSNRIRDQLHNLQEHPQNEHEVMNAHHMWWNPRTAACNIEYFHVKQLALGGWLCGKGSGSSSGSSSGSGSGSEEVESRVASRVAHATHGTKGNIAKCTKRSELLPVNCVDTPLRLLDARTPHENHFVTGPVRPNNSHRRLCGPSQESMMLQVLLCP
jgi:hypothetical protein